MPFLTVIVQIVPYETAASNLLHSLNRQYLNSLPHLKAQNLKCSQTLQDQRRMWCDFWLMMLTFLRVRLSRNASFVENPPGLSTTWSAIWFWFTPVLPVPVNTVPKYSKIPTTWIAILKHAICRKKIPKNFEIQIELVVTVVIKIWPNVSFSIFLFVWSEVQSLWPSCMPSSCIIISYGEFDFPDITFEKGIYELYLYFF